MLHTPKTGLRRRPMGQGSSSSLGARVFPRLRVLYGGRTKHHQGTRHRGWRHHGWRRHHGGVSSTSSRGWVIHFIQEAGCQPDDFKICVFRDIIVTQFQSKSFEKDIKKYISDIFSILSTSSLGERWRK